MLKQKTVVNIHAAKSQLSKLVAAVEAGEEVIIAKAGRPVARLSPVTPAKVTKTMRPGWAGAGLVMSPDFHELPEDVLAAFERKL